ncbi:MAG: RnfABCDGE type electron transport complex subunit B [Candidatus Bipolaricaulota bacterium]|nr:RnfABCDGE type electron transport complex subunit B [Candidatus Bipolaricaulota bacterium]
MIDAQVITSIGLLSLIGFVAGAIILLVNRVLPKEDESLRRASEIHKLLPGIDCGACGYPGCFAYAQAVARDKQVAVDNPCATLSQDEEGMQRLGEYLGLDLEGKESAQKAIVHCTGSSDIIADYDGIQTCTAAAQLASGYKECPYACLGLGDCTRVCPTDAISIDPERKVAFVDWGLCIGCELCVEACPQGLIEMVPTGMPQYLGCNYLSARDVPGRKRCPDGCIHCRICVKVSKEGEVGWDEGKDLPTFDLDRCVPAPAAIEKCPRKIIKKTIAYPEEG